MVKDWKAVQAEICRRYAKGDSLKTVRETLQAERNFHAWYHKCPRVHGRLLTRSSVRAYRLKLLEWKAKRPRKSGNNLTLSQSRNHSVSREAGEEAIISLTSEDEEYHNPNTQGNSSNAISAAVFACHLRPILLDACSCTASELVNHLRLLSESWHASLATPFWYLYPDGDFRDGVDNILHYATRTTETPWGLYRGIVDYLLLHNGIDARDCDGMTALEIAARTSNHKAFSVLLRAGASFRLCSVPNETALHIVMLHCPNADITGELLSFTFMNHPGEATQCYLEVRDRVLESALVRIRCERESELLIKSYGMLSNVISAECQLQSEDHLSSASVDHVFKILVETWDRRMQSPSWPIIEPSAVSCSEWLLTRGTDIFQASDKHSLYSCPPLSDSMSCRCRCGTLAELAMFHQDNDKLALTIIHHHSEQYSERLALTLMDPCPFWTATIDGDELATRFRCVLARLSLPKVGLLLFALQSAHGPLKYPFVQAILSCGLGVDLGLHSEVSNWEVFAALVAIDESYRWSVSELVLAQDAGISQLRNEESAWSYPSFETLGRSGTFATAYMEHLCRRARKTCQRQNLETIALSDAIRPFPTLEGGFRWRQEETQNIARELQRCVVHVFSKMMLDDSCALGKELPRKVRTLWALRLRRYSRLPDILVDNGMLIDALHDCTD